MFDDAMREADSSALRTFMADVDFLARCTQVCGLDAASAMQENGDKLQHNADLGKTVERVVVRCTAPALRPVDIVHRVWMDDTACWSFHNFLHYATQGGVGYVRLESVGDVLLCQRSSPLLSEARMVSVCP